MDPVTMMVASIGMQFFNNYANNKKNKEIQTQQREFQIAAQLHDFERMRKAQSEAAKLAMELEVDLHNDRIKDIESSYDIWLENLAHSFTINNWPLNVLPFIMKGESFGSLITGTSKSISMHCILTPSNCDWFNEYFYDDLDMRVEAAMNNNWNAQSTHPIVYYGGGWNKRVKKTPTAPAIPESINLVDVALLENQLKQYPTLVITPYFDPFLHFRVKLWGMGENSSNTFKIDIPHGDIEPSSRVFSHDYSKNNKLDDTDDLYNTTMEEFVPYLEKLIGFIADKYFWSMYGICPALPEIWKKEKLLFCSPDSLSKDYMSFIEHGDDNIVLSHGTKALLNFYEKCVLIRDEEVRKEYAVKILCQVCNSMREKRECTPDNIESIISETFFTVSDIQFLEGMADIFRHSNKEMYQTLYTTLISIINKINDYNENAISYTFAYITLYDLLGLLLRKYPNGNDDDVLNLNLFPEDHLITAFFICKELNGSYEKTNIVVDGLLVPSELKNQQLRKLKIKRGNINSLMSKISFDCDTNMFSSIITIDKISQYCSQVIEDVKSCNLYIKEDLPNDVIRNIDSNLLPNLMYCEAIGRNGEIKGKLFYFDGIEGTLKEKFQLSNNLTIE